MPAYTTGLFGRKTNPVALTASFKVRARLRTARCGKSSHTIPKNEFEAIEDSQSIELHR